MKRDIARLSAAASRVEADLRRTTTSQWTCSVTNGYVLEVSDGATTEQVLLEDDLDDEEWFAPPGATEAEIDDGLDTDADELLATEVAETLQAFGITWPTCPQHGHVMGACSGWWYCGGEPYHDVAVVGTLGQDGATSG